MAANDVPCCETMFWVYLFICVALVCFAGLMSGLTLGLMSLSLVELEVLIKAGEPHERRNAAKILPLVKNQHLLLCTLLIGNALAMEALPIFVDSLLPAWGAILISVTLILAFGEILPQAVCSRYGLSIGAKLSILVRLIVVILFPLAYPISRLLDVLLGKRHSALLRRAELKTLVCMHGNEAGKGGELTHDETTIISGALDLTQKTAKDAMTPIPKIFSLDIDSKLDEKTMGLISIEGHSRIPIYSGDPTEIIGFILVKNLIKLRREYVTTIRDLPIRRIPRVNESFPLYDILNIFQTGHSHMALVVRTRKDVNSPEDSQNTNREDFAQIRDVACESGQKNGQVVISMPEMNSGDMNRQSPNQYICFIPAEDEEVIGIITLEDVMEELIQEEIFDETDERDIRYIEAHQRITVNMLPRRRNSPSQSPELSTWGSDLPHRSQPASPASPYRQTPLSPINISPTLLRSPIKSPYRQSRIIRSTLYSSTRKQQSPSSPASSLGANCRY